MAQCSKCGSPLGDDQKFCGTCGTPVVPEAAATTETTTAAGAAAAEGAAVAAESAAVAAAATPADVTPPAAPTPPPMPATPQYTPPAYPPQGYAAAQTPQGYTQPPQAYPPGYGQGAYGQGPYAGGTWQPPRKSRKGLWIGLAAAVVVIAVACVLLFVVFKDQVLGGGGGSEASAQQTLSAAFSSIGTADAASGTYDATITLDLNSGGMSAEEQAMVNMIFGGPITASGTFATTASPQALDLSVGATLLGQNIDVEIRMVDGQPYVNYMGQWYEGPPDMGQQLGDSGLDLSQTQQLLSGLSIDPTTWLKGLKTAGSDKIDGVDSTHLTGSPDLVKMITDVSTLMQSSAGQDLMNLGESLGTDTGVSVPTPEELAQMETMLDAMVEDATVDLWVAKDDNSMRKMSLSLRVVPPSDEEMASIEGLADLAGMADMLKSITVVLNVTRDGGNKTVDIQAPASPLPYSDLEDAMQSGMGLLGGLLGGSSGF